MGYLQVHTTVGKREDAEKIAETLVQERLAGCVQIVGPISSVYWWKSKIEKAEEWLCLIKSEETLFHEVEETIKKIHPYEIPEITAVPIVVGSKKIFHMAWPRAQTQKILSRLIKNAHVCGNGILTTLS